MEPNQATTDSESTAYRIVTDGGRDLFGDVDEETLLDLRHTLATATTGDRLILDAVDDRTGDKHTLELAVLDGRRDTMLDVVERDLDEPVGDVDDDERFDLVVRTAALPDRKIGTEYREQELDAREITIVDDPTLDERDEDTYSAFQIDGGERLVVSADRNPSEAWFESDVFVTLEE